MTFLFFGTFQQPLYGKMSYLSFIV